MNTVVNKLLDVDRRARQLLDEAKQYYENTLQETEREKEALRQQLTERAEARVADVRSTEAAAVEEAKARIADSTAKRTAKLDEAYDLHHQEWEEELLRRCIAKVTLDA